MPNCSNHGELPTVDFKVRKDGYVPNVCAVCEREAARKRRRARYADPKMKKTIQQQNEAWRQRNNVTLAEKARDRYHSISEVRNAKIANVYAQRTERAETFRDDRDLFAAIQARGLLPDIPEDVQAIYANLSGMQIMDPLPQSAVGLRYLDTIFNHRFDARTDGFPSLREAIHDEVQLRRVTDYLRRRGDVPTTQSVLQNLRFFINTPAHFAPSAAAAIYNASARGLDVYDPFGGWGGRALGAFCACVRSITVTDLQEKTVAGCERIAEDFKTLSATSGSFMHGDALEYMATTDRRFGFLLTSPPFLDTEDYGNALAVDSKAADWASSFVAPFARSVQRVLRPDGKLAIHAMDRANVPVLSMFTSALEAVGFARETVYGYGRRTRQSVTVFSRHAS